MENQELVLLEDVAGKAIVTAVNIFYPKTGEVEITDITGKVVAGTISNPDFLKSLIGSFGVTPWTGVAPQIVVKKSKEGLFSLKLATQIESAKLPKLS